MRSVFSQALSVSLSGRASRRVFWISALLCLAIGSSVLRLYSELYMTPMRETAWNMVAWAVLLVYLWLSLVLISVWVRRLHDVGRSGLWVLGILLLPGPGTFFLLILGCLRGEEHDNRYGPDPYPEKHANFRFC